MDFPDDSDTDGHDSSLGKQSWKGGRGRGGSSILSGSRSRQSDDLNSDTMSSVVVRRGANSSLLDDSGNLQMLQDECSYICGTLLAASSPVQALDAAVSLAKLLSSSRTRTLFWQTLTPSGGADDFDVPDAAWAGGNSAAPPSILQTVLDALSETVLASPRQIAARAGANSPASSDSTHGPLRKARTKSARRKLKQNLSPKSQSSLDHPPSHRSGTNCPAKATTGLMSHELRQILGVILFRLSFDCTPQDKAIAVQNLKESNELARMLRLSILKHPRMLQAILKLCLDNMGEERAPKQVPSQASTSATVSPSKEDMSVQSIGSKSDTSGFSKNKSRDRKISSEVSSSMTSAGGSSISSLSLTPSSAASMSKSHAKGGDPTKLGRKNRKRRRQLMQGIGSGSVLSAVPETSALDSLDYDDSEIQGRSKQRRVSNDFGFEPPSSSTAAASSVFSLEEPKDCLEDLQSTASASQVLAQVQTLWSAVRKEISELEQSNEESVAVDSPKSRNGYVTSLYLQSLNRVISGKEGDGPSIFETMEELDDENNMEDLPNPIEETNDLLGKSGVLPLLSKCLSRYLALFGAQVLSRKQEVSDTGSWLEIISSLATIIDSSCLFSPQNRSLLVEEESLSFNDDGKDDNIIYQILSFLHRTSNFDETNGEAYPSSDNSINEIRLASLRTLTSLTHENSLAVEQMAERCKFTKLHPVVSNNANLNNSVQTNGIEILAKLAFQLESPAVEAFESQMEEELHRYDCTIFCLNTLANVIDGPDAIAMLADATVATEENETTQQWLRWLCKWVTRQTDTFREAILGLGKNNAELQDDQNELGKSEEEKVVAAGNGCVVLACMLTKSSDEDGDVELADRVRNIIMDELPKSKNGKSTGIVFIINTLKAFCNFYHFSLGELSLAVVQPVKKLIDELQDLQAS